MTRFAIAPGPEGPRYEGPHGPIDIPPAQAPGRTVVHAPDGEASLEWDMRERDADRLAEGIGAQVGGRQLRVRRDGRALLVEDAAGGDLLARLRLRRFGGTLLEGPDGTVLATARPKLEGEVEPAATPEQVTLLVLAMASNLTGALERSFSPLGLFP